MFWCQMKAVLNWGISILVQYYNSFSLQATTSNCFANLCGNCLIVLVHKFTSSQQSNIIKKIRGRLPDIQDTVIQIPPVTFRRDK